jgi:hypothetical protein
VVLLTRDMAINASLSPNWYVTRAWVHSRANTTMLARLTKVQITANAEPPEAVIRNMTEQKVELLTDIHIGPDMRSF